MLLGQARTREVFRVRLTWNAEATNSVLREATIRKVALPYPPAFNARPANFTVKSSVTQTPSLASVAELDPGQTGTAVAQIRTTNGTVIADVFLKDGKTVAALIKNATADAFSRAGYRVVESAAAPTDI